MAARVFDIFVHSSFFFLSHSGQWVLFKCSKGRMSRPDKWGRLLWKTSQHLNQNSSRSTAYNVTPTVSDVTGPGWSQWVVFINLCYKTAVTSFALAAGRLGTFFSAEFGITTVDWKIKSQWKNTQLVRVFYWKWRLLVRMFIFFYHAHVPANLKQFHHHIFLRSTSFPDK